MSQPSLRSARGQASLMMLAVVGPWGVHRSMQVRD
jgi:hypothetical protein